MPPAQAQPSPWWISRGAALVVASGVFLICLFINAGLAWVAVAAVVLMEGAVALLIMLAGGLLGCAILRWMFGEKTAEIPLLLRWSTGIALGLGTFSLAVLGIGLAGEFNRPHAIALLAVASAAGGIGLVHGKTNAIEQSIDQRIKVWLNQPAGWGWLWVAVMPALAIAVLGATLPPGILWGDEPHWYDVMEYHLQVPREWYEAGRMMPLHHNVFSYFPFNVEMLYWLAMTLRGGPWAGMYAAQFLHLGMMIITVMGVAGAAGEWGGSAAKNSAGALVAATPWLTLLAPVAYNEGGLLLYGGLAVIWGLRQLRTGNFRLRTMALAGVMAGLASGVKLTAVPMVFVALGVAMLLVEIIGRWKRTSIVGYLIYFLAGGVVFSPWLIRNLAWTGNPVFPEAMQLLGRSHFTPEQVERWNHAHAATANQLTIGAKLSAGWNQIIIDRRYGGVLWLAAAVAAVVGWRNRSTWLLLILGGGIAFVWLFFTHLQSRFFVLGIPIAGLLAAMTRGKWAHRLMGGAAVVAAIIGWITLQTKLDPYLQRGVLVAVGLEDYRLMIPSQQVVDILDGKDDLALVGDAAAFRYPIPMTRLHYRTVFDVPPDGDAVHAWLKGQPTHPSRPLWLLIDPPELERFTRTYQHIPPVPEWVRQHGEPFVVNVKALP
ncbi:MAG: hypothetical protein IT447_15775 [Phycisphaerales bacterium]|nr:hypothetical protein [Phycisphaerales bacterium]